MNHLYQVCYSQEFGDIKLVNKKFLKLNKTHKVS